MSRRGIIDHVSVGVSDLDRSRAFYAQALAPLGFREHGPWREGARETSFGPGDGSADIAISLDKPLTPGVHIALSATSRDQVDNFHAEAIAAGGRDNGPPGHRPEYSPDYYGAFVLDPDGVNLEAVHRSRIPRRQATPEAPLRETTQGLVPDGDGWFVLNASEATWLDSHFGAFTRFEGRPAFTDVGINVSVLRPGQVSCMYHGEEEQENFLVLSGECLLIIEEQERPLRPWDFVHCPAWTNHVFVGTGDGPCTLLAIGSRAGQGVVYPVSVTAQRHRAGVATETTDPEEAYAGIPADGPTAFDPVWLPG